LATPLGRRRRRRRIYQLPWPMTKELFAISTPKNIIDMTDGDVPDAKRQAFEEYQKARRKLSGRTSYRVLGRLAMEKWWKCKNLSFLLFYNQR
jgi:hypothetical protein